MEEHKAIAKLAEGLRLQDLLREIYGDAAKPGAKQVGKALETALRFGNTLLLPLAFANDRASVLRNNMEKFREKLQDAPEEEICEVAPELGVPITDKLTYVTNTELSDMYIELLAKASQVQHANVAHPSFVNIINNISPDEAVLLKSLRETSNVPFIEVQLKRVDKNEYVVLAPLLLELPCLKNLAYPTNTTAYFSNLEGLGILNVKRDIYLSDNQFYEPLEAHARDKYSKQADQISDRKLTFKRGNIDITAFGNLFLNACYSSSSLD